MSITDLLGTPVFINNLISPDKVWNDRMSGHIYVHVEVYWQLLYKDDKPFADFAISLRRRTLGRLR